ncbi:MAG: hypothetical protein Q8J69_13640 [Sphingobacteriaceae bacterium]|nr:hypothetical protein [Sphingobacteriaceae bacterium]
MPFLLRICIIFVLLTQCGFAQVKDKYLKKMPSNYDHLLCAREKEKGLLMSFNNFKNGKIEAATLPEINTLMTTMLLGSGTYLFELLSKKYPDFKPVVVRPNGYTSTSFQIRYDFQHGSIYLMRIFSNSRGLGLMAAEYPENYLLLYGFDIKDETILKELREQLVQYMKSNYFEFSNVEKKGP